MTIELPGISLRSAQADDLEQIVNLDRLAFAPLRPNSEIQQDWYPQGLSLKGRQPFLAVDDLTGSSVGTYTRLDLQIFLEGQEFPARGLAGVAVAPERRGQRIAQWMLEQELIELKSQQIPLSMLYPFQHGFYRRMGWAWVGRVHQYTIATEHLPVYPERRNVVAFDPTQHTQLLQEAYQRSAQRHNGWLKRQAWHWQSRLKLRSGCEIFCYIEAGKLLGYLMLEYRHLEAIQPASLAIAVEEWVALNSDAYRGMIGFLATLRDQVPTLIWNTYPEDPFPHLLQEQRRDPSLRQFSYFFGLTHRFGEIGGGFMWRLVDLATAFRLRPIRQGPPFALTFEVIDPVLGNQTITANFTAGRMHPVTQPVPMILKTSIEHLTELFCGLRRATELVWTREIEFEGERTLLHQLDAAWEATPPFCWESF
jgi:predicted acetyltransferase